MPEREARSLALSEWLVLCVICEQPTHGFAIAALLGTDGDLGRIWRVPKPVIYRAIPRLERLGLIRTAGEERSAHGPVRSLLKPAPAGRLAAAQWLSIPVEHARDVRSELMIKLALLDRTGADPQPLLLAQQMQLAPIAAALSVRVRDTAGFDHTLAVWRHQAMDATMRFLAAMTPLDWTAAVTRPPDSAS